MDLRNRSVANLRRHFFTTALSKFYVLGVVFVVSVVLARELSPVGVGTLSTIMVVPLLASAAGNLGVRQAFTFFVGRSLATAHELRYAMLWLWGLSSCLGIGLSVVGYIVINYSSGTELAMILGLASIPSTLLANYLEGLAMGRKLIPEINSARYVQVTIYAVFVFLLVVVWGVGVQGAIAALIISQLAQALVLERISNVGQSVGLNVPLRLMRKIIRVGIRYAMGLLIFQLNYRVDVLLLNHFVDKAEVGRYTIGVSFGELLWQLPSVLGFVVFAHGVAPEDREAFSRAVWYGTRRLTMLVGGAAALTALIAPVIVTRIFGDAYVESVRVLWCLIPGIVIAVPFKVLAGDLAARGYPQIATKSFSLALLVNIALNLNLIPQFGALGAAITSSISYSVGTVLFLVKYRRLIRAHTRVNG